MEPNKKKRKKRVSERTNSPVLSSQQTEMQNVASSFSMEEIEDKVFNEINFIELEKSLSNWDKQFKYKEKITKRDMNILKNNISEYMSSFLVFGYDMNDDRIIIQKFETPRDRDAIMEFLKTIFIKQQTENFLD
jgi:hypothetical protein